MKTIKLIIAVAFVLSLSACASTSSTANSSSHRGQFGQCETTQSGRVCAKVVIVDNN